MALDQNAFMFMQGIWKGYKSTGSKKSVMNCKNIQKEIGDKQSPDSWGFIGLKLHPKRPGQ